MHRFIYLKHGLAIVLAFVGVKMMTEEIYHMPIALSLAVIGIVLVGAMGLSLIVTRNKEPEPIGQITHS
jgi:predicted tellurium resistance membrane protein TerC